MKTTEKPLPVILVSAPDSTSGQKFISELIERPEAASSDTTDEYECVWSIENKYYKADVCVKLLVDGRTPPSVDPEAHIVLLAPNECSDGACLTSRAAAARGAGEVLVAAMQCGARDITALEDAARVLRYELVSLIQPQEEEEGEDEWGLTRVRSALHAHTWSSLQRRCSGTAGGEAGAVERAELFAELLGRVTEVRGARGEEPREQQLSRAEQLVAAFCRALGDDDLDLDELDDLDEHDEPYH